MQAVILAGGLGTRLLPLTEHVPKALLEVAGRPFVLWQLERVRDSGFSRVLLCVGHHAEHIRERLEKDRPSGLSLDYSDDGPELLGTAGALRRALPLLDELFLVTYGDSYLPFDYSAPLRDLVGHPEAEGTLAVHPNEGRWDASNTRILGDRVERYKKGSQDPALDHIDYGAMALRRRVIAALPPATKLGLDLVQADLARRGKLRANVATERFYEIGSPAGLAELEAYLEARSGS